LRESVKGVVNDLVEPIPAPASPYSMNSYRLVFRGRKVDAYVNGKAVFSDVDVLADHGFVGFKAWSDSERADSLLESISVRAASQ
jgi:hypothetical protein